MKNLTEVIPSYFSFHLLSIFFRLFSFVYLIGTQKNYELYVNFRFIVQNLKSKPGKIC